MNAPQKLTKPVAIDASLVARAEECGVDIVAVCERALRRASVTPDDDARWIEENRPAMEAWNAWVEEHGLPLGDLRQF